MSSTTERVELRDALEYITTRSGFEFPRRRAQRWCQRGSVLINGTRIELGSVLVERRWYLLRSQLELLIELLNLAQEKTEA